MVDTDVRVRGRVPEASTRRVKRTNESGPVGNEASSERASEEAGGGRVGGSACSTRPRDARAWVVAWARAGSSVTYRRTGAMPRTSTGTGAVAGACTGASVRVVHAHAHSHRCTNPPMSRNVLYRDPGSGISERERGIHLFLDLEATRKVCPFELRIRGEVFWEGRKRY